MDDSGNSGCANVVVGVIALTLLVALYSSQEEREAAQRKQNQRDMAAYNGNVDAMRDTLLATKIVEDNGDLQPRIIFLPESTAENISIDKGGQSFDLFAKQADTTVTVRFSFDRDDRGRTTLHMEGPGAVAAFRIEDLPSTTTLSHPGR